MNLTEDDFTVSSTNYSKIKVTVVDGWLEITPVEAEVEVTITGNTETKEYTGREQRVSGYTYVAKQGETTIAIDEFQVALKEGSEAVAKGTNAGTYPMNLTEDDFTVSSTNYSKIKVTVVDGWLNITPITSPIIITAGSDSKVYDGKPLENAEYTYTEGILIEGDTLEAEIEGKITNVGTVENKVKSYKVIRDNLDITNNYTFGETVNGTLEVSKRSIELTADSAWKLYDGSELTKKSYTITSGGLAEGEKITEIEIEGSQTEIGNSPNTIKEGSVVIKKSGLVNALISLFTDMEVETTANYKIDLVEGNLEVKQRYDLEYTVNRIYLDGDGNVSESDVFDHSETAFYGEHILKTEPDPEVTKNDLHYVFLPNWPGYLETKDKTVGLNADENVVNIYYALDEKGNPGEPDPENPTEPIPDEEDNIPDMYQIVFKYVSAGNGTVNGQTYEPHTFTDDNGEYVVKTSVSPLADITVQPDAEFAFDYWTIDGSRKDFTEEMTILKADTYAKDTIFTAYFAEDTKGGTDPEDPDDNVPDNPDGIPDKYQTIFQFVSAGNGTVEGTVYEVYTFEEDGEYTEASKMPISPEADVTVTAFAGYAFDYWTIDGSQKDFTAAMTQLKSATYTKDTTFVANFDVDTKGGTDPDDPDKVPDNPDGIPDKYQIIFTYESAGNGTVDGTIYEVHTLEADGVYTEVTEAPVSPDANVTVNGANGYIFDYWTIDGTEKDFSETMAALKAETYTEDTTFTAYFKNRTDLSYEVHYFYDETENEAQKVVEDEATFGTTIPYEAPRTATYNNHNYVLETIEKTGDGTVTTTAANNIVNIYYTLDEEGTDPENPDEPGDKIPDKYQITITYVAGANGAVTGETEELHTVKTFDVAADGTISNVQDSPATPAAAVTATPDNGYKFVNWTDGSSSYADVEAIQALQLMEDATFTANFTEEANISILYQAETGGKVSPTEESLAPATGTANGSDAAADTGYRFVNWTNEAGEEVSKDAHFVPQKVNGVNVPATYTAHFEKADFAYGVHYYFDGTEDTSRAVSANGEFEAQIPFEASAAAEFNNRNYTLERIEKLSNGIITANAASNVVNIYYALDEMGTPDPEDPDNRPTEPDGIPDKYQITFNYVSKDTNTGTVTGVTKEVHTVYEFTRNEDGTITVGDVKPAAPNADVTVTPANGYAFDYWTTNGNEKDFTKDMAQLKAETYTKDTTFTAYFAEDTKGATDPADPEDNVPDNPDGIPDKYQTIFQYVSGGHGTVNGTVYEVHTFVEDGVYTEASKMPVKPNADVTVSADSGYRFENWTFGDQSYENADAIKAAEFTADATFTANFERRTTGGGSGSGSGGGGGSTSGGGATSVIRTDGTGETVTINPDEVPLAALPEGGQSGAVSIPDEDVPLFGLPKTGDNSIPVGGLVGMMLVSILGAFGISKKRKGEEEA